MVEVITLCVWTAYLLLWLAVLSLVGKWQKRPSPPGTLVPMPGIYQDAPKVGHDPVLSYGEWLEQYCSITGVLPGFNTATFLYQCYLEHHETVAVSEGEP